MVIMHLTQKGDKLLSVTGRRTYLFTDIHRKLRVEVAFALRTRYKKVLTDWAQNALLFPSG